MPGTALPPLAATPGFSRCCTSRGSVSAGDRAAARSDASLLNRLPRVDRYYRYLLPLMPFAAGLEDHRRRPGRRASATASPRRRRPPAGVPHVCYCFTPMRYAWHMKDAYFRRRACWALKAAADRRAAGAHPRLGPPHGRPRHALRRHQPDVRDRIRDCYGRDSVVIYPPVDTDFYTPGRRAARGLLPRRLGARPVQAVRPGHRGLPQARAEARGDRQRAGRGEVEGDGRAERRSSSAGSRTR